MKRFVKYEARIDTKSLQWLIYCIKNIFYSKFYKEVMNDGKANEGG